MPQRPTYQPLESASRFDDLSFNQTVEDGLADLRLPSLMDSGFASLRSLASPPEPAEPARQRPAYNRLPMVSPPMPMLPLRRPSDDLLNDIDPEAPPPPPPPPPPSTSSPPVSMPQGAPATAPAAPTAPVAAARPAPSAMPQGAPGSKQEKQARVYQASLENGLDDEGARILVAVTETEGGLDGAIGDLSDPRGKGQGSRGPFQFFEGGQMPGFRAWVQQQGIPGDPNVLVHDVDLATRYAATTYLGRAIKAGRAQGLTGAALATYVQEHGQVSIHPERTGANYERMFGQGQAPPTVPAAAQTAPPAPQARAAPMPEQASQGYRIAPVSPVVDMPTPNTSGRRQSTVGIVVHSTNGGAANSAEEYAATLRHFSRPSSQVSANAVIAADGTIAMVGDWDAVTWHAGENNSNRIGVELVQTAKDNIAGVPFTDAQYRSLAWLTAEASRRYGFKIDRTSLVGHQEVEQGRRQGKIDPGAHFDWERYQNESRQILSTPSVVAGDPRQSLNAAGAPSSAAVPLPTAGADGLAPIGPGSPLDDARATQQGDGMMMRGPLQPYPELPADAPLDPSSFGAPEAPRLQSPIILPNVSPVSPILPTSTVGAPFGPASDPTLGDPTYTQAPAVVPPPIRRSSAVDDPAVRTFDDPGTMPLPTPQVRAFDDPGQRPLIAPPPSPYAPGQAESMEPQPNRFVRPPTPEPVQDDTSFGWRQRPARTDETLTPDLPGAVERGYSRAMTPGHSFIDMVGSPSGNADEDVRRRLAYLPEPVQNAIATAQRLGFQLVLGAIPFEIANEAWKEFGFPSAVVAGMEINPGVFLVPQKALMGGINRNAAAEVGARATTGLASAGMREAAALEGFVPGAGSRIGAAISDANFRGVQIPPLAEWGERATGAVGRGIGAGVRAAGAGIAEGGRAVGSAFDGMAPAARRTAHALDPEPVARHPEVVSARAQVQALEQMAEDLVTRIDNTAPGTPEHVALVQQQQRLTGMYDTALEEAGRVSQRVEQELTQTGVVAPRPAVGAAPTGAAEAAARLTVPFRGQVGSATGAVVGAATGAAAGDENTTWDQRLQQALVGAGAGLTGGAALATHGTVSAARLIDSLVERGSLPRTILSSHPNVAERVRAVFALAAHGLPDDAAVEAPAIATLLTRLRPQDRAGVADLLDGPLTAGQVREIVGAQTTPERLGRAVTEIVTDAVTGVRNRVQRGRELAADAATVRPWPTQPRAVRTTGSPTGEVPSTITTPHGPALLIDDPKVTGLVHEVSDALGIERPNVYVTQARVAAASVSHGGGESTNLILGRGLFGSDLTEAEIKALLTHELTHTTEAEAGRSLLGRAADAVSGATASLRRSSDVVPAESAGELKLTAPQMRALTEGQVAAHVEHKGSTFHPTRGNLAGQPLYSVSLYPERSIVFDAPPTAKQMEAFIKDNRVLLADDRLSVGTWFNEANGKHYLDVVATLADRELAEAAGRAHNQIAIYGLRNFEEIATGGTGAVPRVQPPAGMRLPLQGEADAAMRARLSAQARAASEGRPVDWWEREFGMDPKAMAEANLTARPLEQALARSAAASPDNLAHLSGDELAQYMQFRSPSLRELGSAIGKPMGTDDTRRLVSFGLERGYGDWYRVFGRHIARDIAPGILPEEGTGLFSHYSSQLSPEQALDATIATAMAARQTKAFAGMTDEQAHKAVFAMMDEVGITKPSVSAGDVKGGQTLYAQGFKVQSDNSWKTATFQGALRQGQDPASLDIGFTGDVQAQRVSGYKAWHPPAEEVKAAKAAKAAGVPGATEALDWQNKTMADPGAWQFMSGVGRWIAKELNVPPSDAQAAIWVVGQRGVIPLNNNTLSSFRALNPTAPIFVEEAAAKAAGEAAARAAGVKSAKKIEDAGKAAAREAPMLATWTQAAQDIKSGTKNVADVFDDLVRVGAFELKDPGALEQIVQTTSSQNARAAWARGGYADMPYPGAAPMTEGLRYESHVTRPWMRAGPEQGALSPLHARALEEAPTITTTSGRVISDEQRRVPGLSVPHTVVDIGDTASSAIALPTVNSRMLSSVAQALADGGESVVTRRGVAHGELGNSVQVTIDAVAAPGLRGTQAEIRQMGAELGAEVHWDGRQVRMFFDDLTPDDAAQRVLSLYDRVQLRGINADAIKVGAAHVERFDPGGAGNSGVAGAGSGRGSAPARDVDLSQRIASAIRPADDAGVTGRGAAGRRGGPGSVPEGRPDGGVRAGSAAPPLPGLDTAASALAATAGRVLPPAAAGAGAALVADEALAAEEGAEGEGGRTPYGPIAAGVATAALVAVAATPQGRRAATQLARRAAANLKAAPTGTPANALEIAQGYRHSVGMLGNVATGLMNAASGPVELGLGLPTEVIRTGVLRGRPAAVIYEAAELSRGLAQDSRAFVRTALGFIDPAIRAAPDFRPPLAERMQGPAARAVGYAIDTPGRINTQAFDAFFHSAFTRWGRAREAAHLLEEAGVSRLRPDEQVATMNRWLNNPSAQDIADGIPERLAGGAKAFADELTYKGEAGFIEGKLGAIFRSGKTPTTAADPAAEQVWDLAGSLIQPFFHTLFKIQKLSASRVPVTGMLTNRSLPMDEKISRQIVGAALGLYIADRASQGLVTGPGPSDSDQAALVNKESPPESFFVPGVGWLPNSLAGSAGPQLSAIGAYYDARRYATDKEKESGWRMGERTAKDVMRAFADFPTAAGLQLLVGMAESPAKGVTDFVAGLGSQVMPAPARAYIAGQDPFTRTTDRDVEPPEMLGQKLVSRTGYVPGLGSRQDLPVAQDRFGRPVENPRQGWAAFFPNIKRSKGDPIAAVFIDAGVEPGMPKTEVTVVPGAPPIPLTSAEQRRWQALRGAPLIENVPNVSASQAFQEADPASRKAALERMMAATGSAADKQLIAEIGPEVVRRRLEAAVSRKQRGR